MTRIATRPAPHESEPAWEVATLFPPQGAWTEDEYLDLTDDTNKLVELVDGKIEVLPMPTDEHQGIAMYLCFALQSFVAERKLGRVRIAALRVRMSEENFREPDVLFISQQNLERAANRFWKHADLVMEVVSPDRGSHRRDWITKRRQYAKAGISEYWIVDPQLEKIVVLRLEEGQYVTHSEAGRVGKVVSALLKGFSVDARAVWAAAKS